MSKNIFKDTLSINKIKSNIRRNWRTSPTQNTIGTMARDQYWHYWTTAQIKWDGYYYDYSRSIYKDDSIKGDNNKYLFRRNSQDLQWQNLENTWDFKENSQWQRTTICIKIYGEINKGIRNQKDAFNSILSTIRWTNRKDQSGDRNILVTLCQLSARWLDRMDSSGGISLQW